MSGHDKPRVLVFIVAYNAEKTIAKVVRGIPASLLETFRVDVLIIDDCSRDATFEKGNLVSREEDLPFRVTVLFNPVNQGYGGNQKLGYRYAIENGYDFVALIHGDGQYAPECLPELLEPLRNGEASAVFGSRMLMPSGALRGGMPLYKYAGNRVLTWTENKLLKSNLSEFHSGYRLYSTRALAAIPFERNSNVFHFDTEIIIQLLIAGLTIRELPIPTHYGDEVCHVNGIKYAKDVIVAAVKARLQNLGLFYDRKFDCALPQARADKPILAWDSPHSFVLKSVKPGSKVLELGRNGLDLATALGERKQCEVDFVDARIASGVPNIDYSKYDYLVLIEVIEHLARPEEFLDELGTAIGANPRLEVLVSTANVGFIIPRLMLLAGQFNQGRRGILDMTHTRLFTFSSFERTVAQSGFDILDRAGIPGPFPLALGDNAFSRFLLNTNRALIRLSRGLFSYQIVLRIKPQPSLERLLQTAVEVSKERAALLERTEA